jgi:Mg2+/Co2+ transporter CorB
MNWTLWLLLVAMLALAALMSVTRACLNAAARTKPAAAQRLRNERVRSLDDLMAEPQSLDWALALIENAAKIAAACLGALLVIAYQDARFLALCIVVVLGLLALAPILVSRIADRIAYRFCLGALPILQYAAKLAATPYAGLRKAFDASPRKTSNGAPEPNGGRLVASEAGSSKSGDDAARKDRAMLGGLLNLKELEVSDVMIHRTEMATINVDLPAEEIVRTMLATPHTRLPLWRDHPENIVGTLRSKDVLRTLQGAGGDATKIDIAAIMTPPWFVPDTTPLAEQLKAFRRRKTRFALVVDEYGQVMGLVTLDDIVGEIIGDISDERDVDIPGVRTQLDGSVHIEGSVPIRDLNRAMDWTLPDAQATTIAGLVIHEARSIPEVGQSFTFHGFRFRVLRKSRNRITALRVTRVDRRAPKTS